MRGRDCQRFEEAIASESALEETLLHHAASCPRCRALVQVRDLSVAPVAVDRDDSFVKDVLAIAGEIAVTRATHWERHRKTVALSIGITGYILAAASLLLGSPSYGNGHSALSRLLDAQVPAVPPPDVTSIAAVVMVSAVWITGLAFVTRSRWASTAEP